MIKNLLRPIYHKYRRTVGLNPIKVTEAQAQRFYQMTLAENRSMIDKATPWIKQANTIFDVGANCGFFAKELCSATGFNGRIVLFEPIPNLASIAVKSLEPYNAQKIFVNSALGEENGTLELYLPNDSNIGWITAVEEKTNHQLPYRVQASKTGDFVKLYMPEFVKIDVEGFEALVLRPFSELVGDKYRPAFLVELGWGKTNPYWQIFMGTAEIFISKGYRFETVGGKKLDLQTLSALDSSIDVFLLPE